MQRISFPLAVPVFVLVMAGVFAAQFTGKLDSLPFALSKLEIDPLNLFLHGLFHGHLAHTLGNILFLLAFGWALETRFGAVAILALLVLGQIAGAFAWIYFGPSQPVYLLGSSAGVTAMACVYVLLELGQTQSLALAFVWGVHQAILAPSNDFATSSLVLHGGGAAAGLVVLLGYKAMNLESSLIRFEKNEKTPVLPKRPGIPGAARPTQAIDLNAGTTAQTKTNSASIPAKEAVKPTESSKSEPKTSGRKSVPISADGGTDEATLKSILESNPMDVEANIQLLDRHLRKSRQAEASFLGRRTVQLLIEQGDLGRAYECYRRIMERFGGFEIGSHQLMQLISHRLDLGDWPPCGAMIVHMVAIEPSNRHLPDEIARMIKLMMLHRGPHAEDTQRWIKRLEEQYPAHPAAKELRAAMDSRDEPFRYDEVTPQTVNTLIEEKRFEEAVDALIDNDPLVAGFEPADLFRLVQSMWFRDETLPKAVILLELTVRSHLKHPMIPNLIVELISVYLSRLNRLDRAGEWRDFLLKRYPGTQAALQAREMVK